MKYLFFYIERKFRKYSYISEVRGMPSIKRIYEFITEKELYHNDNQYVIIDENFNIISLEKFKELFKKETDEENEKNTI